MGGVFDVILLIQTSPEKENAKQKPRP